MNYCSFFINYILISLFLCHINESKTKKPFQIIIGFALFHSFMCDFNILDNFNQKAYSPKLNSSALSARSISDNGEFICRVTEPSDRDSFDELFDPIVDSHI